MNSSIQALPIEVVNLIAAGEVIDSLAAVVRELAENAIDAGATRITVKVCAEQWRVQVVDNGVGFSREDLQQAAIAHTTSKIRNRADLTQIRSLGFRGEALHSLAQLAQLTIFSRQSSLSYGWKVQYDCDGQVIQPEEVAIAPGTIVTVDHLFGSWLNRRESLPPAKVQLRAVQQIIQSIALGHPQVTWQVYQGDGELGKSKERDWFNIWAGQGMLQILPQLLPQVRAEDLREVQQGAVTVLLGLPDRCHRHRPDWVRIAVNGRFVQFPELESTLYQAFRKTLPRDRHPICLVHLNVAIEDVDWNRHPAKAEIFLKDLPQWQIAIETVIHTALQIETDPQERDRRTQALLKTAESAGGYHTQRQIDNRASLQFTTLKVLAQVHQMYILAEHPTGLWMIEQHIAHERVLYEQIRDRWHIIPLQTPVLLKSLSDLQIEQLERLELEVDAFGEQLWAVRSAPALLAERSDLEAALIELSLAGDLQAAQVATACRSAIRNGTPLTLTEMQHLVDQWQHTTNPRTCPHGRPIYLTLEESSLSRFFRRHWVIGKSHGI
ncbi:MAG: DNA mismatch repair endonuclease MutL [Synechococcales bacterium]|nr:DNA mismatch repair endonuclease MutL [Synechococcales bacterium]